MKISNAIVAGALALAMSHGASAATITWSDLTQAGSNTISGTVGGTSVVYSGSYVGPTRVSGPGTQYWAPFPSGDGPLTGPDPLDIIAINSGGLKTIVFGQTVKDVYIAVNSWNGQTATFSAPMSIYAQGRGFWGTGSGTLSNNDMTITASGELHGILKFSGNFTQLTFNDVGENWHGIQIGIGNLAVPEPSTWAMLILGFGAVGGALRRRRTAVSFA